MNQKETTKPRDYTMIHRAYDGKLALGVLLTPQLPDLLKRFILEDVVEENLSSRSSHFDYGVYGIDVENNYPKIGQSSVIISGLDEQMARTLGFID